MVYNHRITNVIVVDVITMGTSCKSWTETEMTPCKIRSFAPVCSLVIVVKMFFSCIQLWMYFVCVNILAIATIKL